MVGRVLAVAVVAALLATACSGADSSTPSSTTIEDYPDAQTRALRARARERRPVPNSALPPRHLEADRWPETLVERTRIVSGGPPPDAIPSIDEPRFDAVADVDWLGDSEPVAVLTAGGETRIYPIQILIWHEIVNDSLGGVPVTVTYCPLCNSVVAYEREVDGQLYDFGTSGALYQSALVMYDRQTESLWTHFDGRAVVGELIGTELTLVPAGLVSWSDAAGAHPDADVLNRETGADRPYGESPYPNYENQALPSAGHVTGEVDDRLAAKARVVGVDFGDSAAPLAIDRAELERERVLAVAEGAVALWAPGTTSALDGEAVAGGVEVGAVGVYWATVDGEELTFDLDGDSVVDDQTGSTWSVLGRAVDGPLAGTQLEPIVHIDTFWFAWVRYHPDTTVFE